MTIRRATLLAVCCAAALDSAQLATWEAGTPASQGGITLVQAPQSEWAIEPAGKVRAAHLKPVASY